MSYRLWPNGPVYTGAPVWTDSLVLADFASKGVSSRCADLGCGDGILILLLSSVLPGLHIDGIDFFPEAVSNCRTNICDNGIETLCTVREEDLRSNSLCRGAYDLVVSNPPYFPQGSGAVSPNERNALARVESATLPELCSAAAALLKNGGRFCLVHRPERLQELLTALSAASLSVKRMRFVCTTALTEPSLVLVEAKKGAKPGARICPSLLLRNEDGTESPEYLQISHYKGD